VAVQPASRAEGDDDSAVGDDPPSFDQPYRDEGPDRPPPPGHADQPREDVDTDTPPGDGPEADRVAVDQVEGDDPPQPPAPDDQGEPDPREGYDQPGAQPAETAPPPEPHENPATPDLTPRELDPQGRGPTRVVALMNQKGGVGKTTTAVNLAAALAERGHRVLAIDLDPQAHLTLSLGLDPEQLSGSVYDLLTGSGPDAEAAALAVEHPEHDRLHVLPAETNLAGVEAELADMVATGLAQTLLRRKLEPVLGSYDVVLMDCPPSLGLLTVGALAAAREVVVPMQAHFLALQGLGKLLETVRMVSMGINPELRVAGVVLCMHEQQTLLAGEVVGEVRGFMEQARGQGLPWSDAVVYEPPVRRNIKLAEAPSFGQSVLAYAPESHGAADYRALAGAFVSQRAAA
jgi:chromosome partitioning protein